jgi:hypothetical protein
VPKREVKEYTTPPPNRRRGSDEGITIREPAWQQQRRVGSGDMTLMVPKPEVKEEEDDEETAKVLEYLGWQCLIVGSDDPEDCPRYFITMHLMRKGGISLEMEVVCVDKMHM